MEYLKRSKHAVWHVISAYRYAPEGPPDKYYTYCGREYDVLDVALNKWPQPPPPSNTICDVCNKAFVAQCCR